MYRKLTHFTNLCCFGSHDKMGEHDTCYSIVLDQGPEDVQSLPDSVSMSLFSLLHTPKLYPHPGTSYETLSSVIWGFAILVFLSLLFAFHRITP